MKASCSRGFCFFSKAIVIDSFYRGNGVAKGFHFVDVVLFQVLFPSNLLYMLLILKLYQLVVAQIFSYCFYFLVKFITFAIKY